MQGFMEFVRKQGVVGLAVGLAIGIQVTGTVDAIVKNLIDPIVGWFLGLFLDGGGSLTSLTWTIGEGSNAFTIGWGAVLSALLSLIAVAFVLYYAVMKTGLDKLDKGEK